MKKYTKENENEVMNHSIPTKGIENRIYILITESKKCL